MLVIFFDLNVSSGLFYEDCMARSLTAVLLCLTFCYLAHRRFLINKILHLDY
ncbi:hypothetical protein BCR42DRAFT_417492 [Absidia repens]|uniref:Uncharacterized protein n=1 Tax=Absidia repens TaxID=90262 RepID=A0A1X2IDY7_9FUNG|nr:hypothetical protein BCR42DRAFT_417492 [Absidia repens]